ncbi:DUF452 family protein [Plebeiibacterium marinum]|uniref:DUF452 family protein n=1 Tax=Plebeiibacterium marinum TaxID=2992111 RepID=A0AAE3MH84_9BACT|nr:pimeloyl-ACP methyl esterase BioG family protein [Plebeiobacterium marinum]MCW3807793.1 DUF452 family protein [Plebeiobacterium marinum]
MKHTWLNNSNQNKLILFFNGWGCDEHQFNHLSSQEFDVMMLNDYRELKLAPEVIAQIKNYDEILLIGWSYGVWIGQHVCEQYCIQIKEGVAVNGTLKPVHEQFGIAETIVQGTLNNLNERNLMKFQRRMLGGNEAWKKFEADKPQRDFNDQKDELAALIQHFKSDTSDTTPYQKAFIGSSDMIFLAKNQLDFWKEKATIKEIDAPHFCFYHFNRWEDIIR